MKPLPPSRYTPSGRITAPEPDAMEPSARASYDDSLRMFGGPGGPRMPLLHVPAIAEGWGGLSRGILRSTLPPRYRELAIITVAAFWRSEMEWLMHASEAADHGIDAAAIDAIRRGTPPAFTNDGDAIVHRYVGELQDRRRVSDPTYGAARALLGDAAVVALTVTVGHYTNVAMTLRAHEVPIPDGTPRAFDDAPA